MTPGTASRAARLIALVERYGVECHAIGWHRARYETETAPAHLREQRDSALAGIERLAREMDTDTAALRTDA